jgi:multicomponent Na+:H+ antiporter subunit G
VSWTQIADVAAAVLLVAGCALSLAGAVGILRLPDLLSRMHALTKPQTLGLLLVVTGLAVRLRDLPSFGMLLLIVLFQFTTTPVASHMLSRAGFRAGLVRRELLLVDDLSETLQSQGHAPGEPGADRQPPPEAGQRPV